MVSCEAALWAAASRACQNNLKQASLVQSRNSKFRYMKVAFSMLAVIHLSFCSTFSTFVLSSFDSLVHPSTHPAEMPFQNANPRGDD